jgi:superoxide dismutase, Cu-Zn family
MRIPSLSKYFIGMIAVPACILVACGNNESTTTNENMDTAVTENTTTNMGNADTGTSNMGNGMAGGAEAVLTGTQADTALSGTVRFQENGGKVTMNLEITAAKLANKTVAVHIHEHGSCGDMGKEAHGHWNPTKMQHGKWGSAQFHRGDIGNVQLDAAGKGTMQLETDLWSINDSDSTKNILNRAIIVHGGTDDYKTQPTGNAGTRLGCGVITKR